MALGPEVIPQRVLRNEIGEILRRAEAGEEFIVTTNGRPVAKVVPITSARNAPASMPRLPTTPAKRRGGWKDLPLYPGEETVMEALNALREERV